MAAAAAVGLVVSMGDSGMKAVVERCILLPSSQPAAAISTSLSPNLSQVNPYYVIIYNSNLSSSTDRSIKVALVASYFKANCKLNKKKKQVQMMMSGNDFLKSQVLSHWRKVESDGDYYYKWTQDFSPHV